jgi:MFS family permease
MLRPVEVGAAKHLERLPPVLANRGFLYLWLAQIISQTAQNAILYGLIILVLDRTKSTTSTSVVVLTFVVPTVAFGVFSGVLVDRWSKRRLLILTNIGRAVASLAYFFARDYVFVVYAITIFFSSFSQLFTTSNAASVPYMVPRQQLISANSLFSGGFTIAQIAGLIILSPILLKTGGQPALFATATVAFLVAAMLSRLLPYIGGEGEEEEERAFPGWQELRGAFAEFRQALNVLRADSQSTLAMAHITVSSTLILLFAVLVPRYMQAILKVPPDNAVAVFAPVAVGALIGLRAVPWVVARLGKTRTVALGLFGIALCLIGMGFIEVIASALHHTENFNPFKSGTERIFGLSILVALTMAFAGPLGVAYAMLNTPAQTTLHERIPVEMRGRVLASQMVLANGVALVPLVVVGGIADLLGVSATILGIGVLVGCAGAVSLYLERRWLQDGESQPPGDAGSDWGRRTQTVPGSIDTIESGSLD